jgi:hypothetical protein
LQKALFPYDSDSDDEDDFASLYNTIPIADDLENIIPKLE